MMNEHPNQTPDHHAASAFAERMRDDLAEAQYSLNRLMTTLNENVLFEPNEREAADLELFTAARDKIWEIRQILDPTLKD